MATEALLHDLWREDRLRQFVDTSCDDIKPSLNALDSSGKSVVHHAVERGDVAFLTAVLKIPGVQVNATDNIHDTPLMLAIRLGRDDAVRILLSSADIDVNKLVATSTSALCVSISADQHACMRLLLSDPAIVVNPKGSGVTVPILHAAKMGKLHALRTLASTPGIDLNVRNGYGRSVLHFAALNGHDECVRYLVDLPGVDAEVRDKARETALDTAVRSNADSCVNVLLPRVSFKQLLHAHISHERMREHIEREIIARCASAYLREDVIMLLVCVSKRGNGAATLRTLNHNRHHKRRKDLLPKPKPYRTRSQCKAMQPSQ